MIKEYLEEAIQLELNVSKLYIKYSSLNDIDYTFWYALALEEGNHASILKNILQSIDMIKYKFSIGETELNELKETNVFIRQYIVMENITREEALSIALSLEETAGEIHYQQLIDEDIGDRIMEIFIKLNKEDEHHADRIREYASINGIII